MMSLSVSSVNCQQVTPHGGPQICLLFILYLENEEKLTLQKFVFETYYFCYHGNRNKCFAKI